jgi:hypothetical protein
MHLFRAKAEAEAKAEAKAEAEAKEKIESYITLVEAEISSQGRDEKLLEYKAIFAKSFFNVAEKPITPENNDIYEQLNKLGGDKITPVGELDYSQAKIPSTQEEYSQAYARARKAVLKEVNKNSRDLGDNSMLKEEKLKEANLALSSENLVINDIKLFDRGLGNGLAGFSNVAAVDRQLARVGRAKSVAQNQAGLLRAKTLSLQSPENATKIENLELTEVVRKLSNRNDSINQRLTTQGIALDGNKTQSEREETPSSSPREPKASCLSAMFKAMTNFSSIFHKLRSGSGGSKGGQVR